MRIDKTALCEYTQVPDAFINVYLGSADGDHVKVYLYLLKNASSAETIRTDAMAAELHMSEKKVFEALNAWQKEGLWELTYENGLLSSVRFLNPSSAAAAKGKHQITQSRLKQLKKSDDEAGQLIFVAEEYFGRGLTPSEARTLLYFYDNIGFSVELCDYLIEYCAAMTGSRARDFSGYMNKVAISWNDAGIKTAAEAKENSPIRKKDPAAPGKTASASRPAFSNFAQHDYDFDELTKRAKQI